MICFQAACYDSLHETRQAVRGLPASVRAEQHVTVVCTVKAAEAALIEVWNEVHRHARRVEKPVDLCIAEKADLLSRCLELNQPVESRTFARLRAGKQQTVVAGSLPGQRSFTGTLFMFLRRFGFGARVASQYEQSVQDGAFLVCVACQGLDSEQSSRIAAALSATGTRRFDESRDRT